MQESHLVARILFIAVVMSIAACLQIFQASFIYWRPVFWEEGWRWWTAHWVHVGWIHYALNMVGLACLPFIFPFARIRFLLLLLFLLPPVLSFGFYYLYPSIDAYAGLSGILHGMYMAMALYFITVVEERRFAAVVLFLILGKILWEQTFGSLQTAQLIGSPVLVEAHLLGSSSGLILALMYLAYRCVQLKFRQKGAEKQ